MYPIEEKSRISIRTDAKLKTEATQVLAEMQLDLSTAINLFLDQVVKQNKLPFEITNETAVEKELRQLRTSAERGIAQALVAEDGIDAEDYLAELKAKKNHMFNRK